MAQLHENIQNLLGPGMSLGGDKESGPIVEFEKDGHRGRISLFGGQMLEWQPAGHEPVLWLSSAAVFDQRTAIRGGIPVCWPWFGAHGTEEDYPSHGFARTNVWPYDEAGADDPPGTAYLSFPIWDSQKNYWPNSSRPCVRYQMGESLSIALTIMNIDPHPIELSQALHTYFSVGDIEAVTIEGLEECPFIDKLSGRELPAANQPITISEETDRIYRELRGPIRLRDAVNNRVITIEHTGATNAIVWNPWVEKSARLGDMGPLDAYRGMVCIETGNVAPDKLKLAPYETHTLGTRISVSNEIGT